MAQSKKIGRNKKECERYRKENRTAINKARNIERAKKQAMKKAATFKTPHGYARMIRREVFGDYSPV